MKKYTEILAEIKEARAAMTNTAKTEKELERIDFLEASQNGTPEEKEAAYKKLKIAADRLAEEEAHNNDIKIKIEILKENAKQALFTECITTICEVWNKYAGKPHGEKTAQKIRDELKNATGHRVYINNRWDDAHITIHPGTDGYADEIEICPVWNGEKQPALNSQNKIIKLSPENMRVCYCREYVNDINTHINELKTAHTEAKKALETYRAAIDKYNNLTRGNMASASDREGIKSYII